jgi:hypothetical protein
MTKKFSTGGIYQIVQELKVPISVCKFNQIVAMSPFKVLDLKKIVPNYRCLRACKGGIALVRKIEYQPRPKLTLILSALLLIATPVFAWATGPLDEAVLVLDIYPSEKDKESYELVYGTENIYLMNAFDRFNRRTYGRPNEVTRLKAEMGDQ